MVRSNIGHCLFLGDTKPCISDLPYRFSFIEKAGDFTDDVGNLQPGNRISCKTGGVKRSEKKQDKAGCCIKKLLEKQRAFCGFIQSSGVSGRTGAET